MSTNDGGATPAVLRTRSWLTWGGYIVVSVVTIIFLLYKIQMYKKEEGPVKVGTTVTTPSKFPPPVTLRMGPGEESMRVPVPPLTRVIAGGTDFRWNCYYSDGHVEKGSCSDGPVIEVSVTNTRGDNNTVVIAYRDL
jgi:hypothetical protein